MKGLNQQPTFTAARSISGDSQRAVSSQGASPWHETWHAASFKVARNQQSHHDYIYNYTHSTISYIYIPKHLYIQYSVSRSVQWIHTHTDMYKYIWVIILDIYIYTVYISVLSPIYYKHNPRISMDFLFPCLIATGILHPR